MDNKNNVKNGLIKPINKNVVHQICSGQVILSLAVAVKELVENSIDAGATIIDISLKEYGSEIIEVSDNGNGVLEENFEALTLKHYTSKIEEFSDLQNLETLGFRGEALSSLCALADLTIVTKHASVEHAKKIKYDKDGKVSEICPAARQTGTTVTLENLFATLPVRRKEFMKNLKREFNKMCQLLYAYCLVSKGIKFTCNNTTNKGNKNVVVATQGLNKVKENIISVFGAKQISTLIDIEVVKPDQNVLDEFNIKLNPTEELPFDLEFIISSVTHGNGRSTTDRQFFYVNSRPVEPTKIIKLVNQIYKQFNVNQCPFVYLNILLKKSIVDINVTPDKRQIFLENEKLFLATIKTSLLEAFKLFPSRLPVENKDISDFFSTSNNHERKGIKRSLTDTEQMKKGYLDSFRKKSKSDNSINVGKKDYSSLELDESLRIKKEEKVETTFLEVPSCRLEKHRESHVDTVSSVIEDKSPVKLIKSLEDDETSRKITKVCKDEASSPEESTIKQNVDIPEIEIVLDAPSNNHVNRKKVHLDITLNDIRESFDFTKSEEALSQFKVKFHSTISPENNEKAEEELQKQLSKKDFSDMEIIGQFNLGFIITRLSNDLFIVDQHATDEKYNFEQLQATTVLQKQNLVNPKPMELTAGNESILIENEEIFRKNGFHFKIDKTAASTKRILLTAVPVIQNLVFGKDDIDEMLFMLKDASHTMCRPSRVRTLLASKACRKSVMVGKSLSPKDMKQLVEHMGEIEQPWNCPHGRPTIRHLINLSLLKKDDD